MCHFDFLRSKNKDLKTLEHQIDRRTFLSQTSLGLGALALGSLLEVDQKDDGRANDSKNHTITSNNNVIGLHHHLPKVKRAIYLFQSGGPSQLELFDYKPQLKKLVGQDLPASVRRGQRLTGMSADQTSFPIAASTLSFNQYGRSRAWVSEAMPYLSEVVDDICFIKSMQTDAINHDPAITFFQTGSQLPGRPSIGSWLSYGLGSLNNNLPTFITLVSKNGSGQPLYSRLWGNGFLPTQHQGVQFRNGVDPVLYLSNPENYDGDDRRQMLDYLQRLNKIQNDVYGDPELEARMAQYEMAYRMQTSVPDVVDMSDEPEYIFDLYGADSKDQGSYAANCLLGRKLLEKDVRFVQIYHQGWDQHSDCPNGVLSNSRKTDQANAALIKDLKQRGMFEDTLIIWGGEFGRTVYSQGKLTATNYGRDHHPKAFTMFMAGAGVRPGFSYGVTDDFGYNVVQDPVHTHDFQATLLHLFGVDHERLTFKHQGRRHRLTDVHGKVVHDILS